nr:VirB3 family type IV secretion system protein [Salmonella enterica]
MSRVPNFAGVPVFALLFLSIGGVIGTFLSVYFWGWWGLLVALPFVLIILGLRIICERDDKAFRRLRFILRRRKMNRKYGRHLLITPPKSSLERKICKTSYQETYSRRRVMQRFPGWDITYILKSVLLVRLIYWRWFVLRAFRMIRVIRQP